MRTFGATIALMLVLATGLTACGTNSGQAPQNPSPAAGAGSGSGGGGGDAGGEAAQEDPNNPDKRAAALTCVKERGISAAPVGDKGIAIDGPSGPRIDFFQSSAEAEGAQFEGEAEGAQQIGAALLFVRNADDELLEELEACLDEQ